MEKFVILILATLVLSGCTASGRIRFQVGSDVNIQNDCAPILDVEHITGVVQKRIPYSQSRLVETSSVPFSGYYRCSTLRVKGYTADMGYLGSATQEFCVDTYYGSREAFWTVTEIRHPPTGQNGCQAWRQTPIPPPSPPPPPPLPPPPAKR